MKINKKNLVDFLEKVNMNGDLNEARFNFTETGLKISGTNAANITRVDGTLNISAFVEYNALGEIGVQEINNIIRILKSFDKEVEINVQGNLLSLKEAGKKVEIELLDLQFIEVVKDLPNLEFYEDIKVNAVDINKFITDASINKEFFIKIETKEKVSMLSNDGKFKFTKTLETPESKGGTVVKFGLHFINAVIKLSDSLILSIKKDYPIKIVEKTEQSIISIITAPVMGNEDIATSEQVKSDDDSEQVKSDDEEIVEETQEE
jgi:hypothetical protein